MQQVASLDHVIREGGLAADVQMSAVVSNSLPDAPAVADGVVA